MSCSAMGAGFLMLGGCALCMYTFKVIISLCFIISGWACLINEDCSIDDKTSSAFIGVGIGMAISTIISIIAIVVWEVKENKKNKSLLVLFICKILIALIFIISGSVIIERDILGGGLIGTGVGTIFSAIFSGAIVFFI